MGTTIKAECCTQSAQDSSQPINHSRNTSNRMEFSTRVAACEHKEGWGRRPTNWTLTCSRIFAASHQSSYRQAKACRRCKEAVTHLAGVHADDTRELEVLLWQAHALGPVGNMTLTHLPALLVLYHAEHPECPVLPCNQTAAGNSPACLGQGLLLSTAAPIMQGQVHKR